jgi:LuxR family maltose regulon positive regulatory protein
LEHAEHALNTQAERQELEVPTDGGMVTEIPAAIALTRAEVAADRGDPQKTAEFAHLALAQLAEQERGPRLWGRWLLSLADWMSGHMEKAELAFTGILAEARTTADPHPLTTSCHTLGWVQQDQGRLGAALHTYREGLRFASESGRLLPLHAGEAHIGIAQVLYARNELDEALLHVTEGIALTRQVVEFRLHAFGLVSLAWIRQARGDTEGALLAIAEACHLLPATDVVSMFSPAQTERAALLLAQGQVEEAADWMGQRGLTADDDLSYPRERDYLVLARLLLAQSQPDQALYLLGRLDALAASHGRLRSLMEIRALRSVAYQASGKHQMALTFLAEALGLARPEGHVRVFADVGSSMAALLRSLISARWQGLAAGNAAAANDHVRQVVRAFGLVGYSAGMTTPAAVGGVIEPLTDRELEVLRLLAAGRRNRDIAQELVVTLETVKKHVSHIFNKLGASNRTQAVAHARALGLIP